MRTLGKLFIIFTALLALAVAFAWRHFTAPTTPETASRTTASQRPTAGTSAPAPASPTHSSRTPATDPVTAFEALKQRAKEGDAVSQRLLAQTYEACFVVNLHRERFLQMYQRARQDRPEQVATLDHLTQQRIEQCNAVDDGAIIPQELIRGWYAQAAENGDLAARAVEYAVKRTPLDAPTATRFLEDIVTSGDPAAMHSLGNVMGGTVTENVGEPYKELVSGPLAAAAWSLAACRMGYDCGPDSTDIGNFCMLVGRCLGETSEEMVFATVKSDADRAALEQKIQQILEAVGP